MNNLLKQGWADYDQGQHTDALRAAQTVLTLTPNLPMALALKAMCELWLTDNVAGTVRTLKKLVKSYPNFPRLHISLGAALGFSGDMEAAEKCYLKALELNPNNFGTYHFLATIRKYDRIEPFAAHMLELVESGRLSEQQECPLRFALAKIFADMRDYEQAVKHVLRANELTAGHYNPAASEAHLDSLKTLRDDGGFRSLKPSGVGSAKPLFIVGPARSGTTLTESILGAHSQVRPCGEMPDIIDIERELTREMNARAGKNLTPLQALVMATPEDLRPKAEKMLATAQAQGQGPFRIFTDKMPPNGLRIGLIARLFPHARVMVMQRDPRDVAVSSLFVRLHKNYGYTRKLEWLGHYANYYAGAIALWRQMVDLEFFDLNYEELAADPEPMIRSMLDFADLKFEAACVHPERSTHNIKTASLWQARQSINAKSVGRWKNYEPWLGPLLEALDQYQNLAKP